MRDPTVLRAFPLAAIEALAAGHEAEAKALRALAAEEAWRRRRLAESTALFARCFATPRLVARHAALGLTPAAAIEAAAAEAGVPPETVLAHVRRRARDQAAADRRARDLAVMRLAGRGWRNAEIGARLGLHPHSVSRIVRRMLATPPAAADPPSLDAIVAALRASLRRDRKDGHR